MKRFTTKTFNIFDPNNYFILCRLYKGWKGMTKSMEEIVPDMLKTFGIKDV